MAKKRHRKIHRSLLGGGGDPLENRKLLNFWARYTIAVANSVTFLILLALLFWSDVKETSRDFISVLVGTYVAILVKITDYFFREKKDAEHEEDNNGK